MLKDVPPSCSFKTKCVADFGVTVQILWGSVPIWKETLQGEILDLQS